MLRITKSMRIRRSELSGIRAGKFVLEEASDFIVLYVLANSAEI